LIIATVHLKSKDFGDDDKITIVENPLNKRNRSSYFEVPYDSELAKKIFFTVANNNNHFECNGVSYEIMQYHPNPELEKKYNTFRKTKRTINTIIDKEIIIYVTYGKIGCEQKGHKTESAKAIVLSKSDNKPVTIDIEYCPQCNIYFINRTSLQIYQKIYHTLLFRMDIFPEHKEHFENNSWGRTKHELAILGYSVSDSSGLTSKERHEILQYAMDYNVLGLDKGKIKTHLEWLIRKGENNAQWEGCIPCWESDLQFVLDYCPEGEDTLYTNGVLQRK
jgi:hypothetical protein